MLPTLDRTLEATYQRRLNLKEHAAWQILHGALAFGREFRVEEEPGGAWIPALDHILNGGKMSGWTVEPGVILEPSTGRRGLRALLEQGSKTGQGHVDQWLAILAQCNLPAEQQIKVGEDVFQMADYVGQVQWDVARNLDQEFSWTLIGLSSYLPIGAEWIAQDGQTWSIERLVEAELQQDLSTSACGGTHRMIGLALALNQRLSQSGSLEGVWLDAEQRVQQAIADARRYQNADGSFSTNYFSRGSRSPDLAQNLGATGHVLEFLTLALTQDQLEEAWVQRAALYVCDLLEQTRDVPLECGALYHAAHGLVIYRERLFGPRTYLRPYR
jgi:hypothetical protein